LRPQNHRKALLGKGTSFGNLAAGHYSGLVTDPNYKGKGLQLEFTVEDDGAFTSPWSATITYRRPLGTGWPQHVCAANILISAWKNEDVPHADKPDF